MNGDFTSIKSVLDQWARNAKKYFFRYRKGFYELFIAADSPQIMIRNFEQMPLVKHKREAQIIQTENLFLRVAIYYNELNPQLFLLLTDSFYKKNVLDIMLYDSRVNAEYYFLSLKTISHEVKDSSTMVNGTRFSSDTWALSKPGGSKNIVHFKNSTELFYTIYFTQAWLDDCIEKCDERTHRFFQAFQASDSTFFMLPRQVSVELPDYAAFRQRMTETKAPSTEALYESTLLLFQEFSRNIPDDMLLKNNLTLSNESRIKLLKAENYLSKYYTLEFPGIDTIANHAGMSPTALKTGFQQLFGCTVFQYHRKQKMQIAKSILQNQKETIIKDLAHQLGYDNAAKFAAAFKAETGLLPSEVNDN
ncbi:MAG: AraC family transcriptional regulator [Bacteroidetes bacterium]|nr:MAG: AraC family transcriptional regulator [Bacteroidota bacterium]